MTRWLTIEKAADSTGLPASYFHERTSPTSGVWAEGVVWKWFEGRKLVDLEALYNLIDQAPSVASMRGRRRGAGQPACQQPNAQAAA
jgi:hypothetical protein